MIYPITVYGDPVLRKLAADVKHDFAGLDKLIGDMFDTMHNADGIGIAAPQIGLDIRIFVVDLTPLGDEDPSLKDFRKVFINPRIVLKEGEQVLMEEGCLSIPGLREDVLRYDTIQIKYLDSDWQEYDEIFTGFSARVIQHEYDHLQGVMFVDYCSPLKKRLLKGRLSDITRGKVTTTYRTKTPKV
jgi:peptide deformylase